MRRAIPALLCLALVAGCIPVSLKPIYGAGDTYFDPKLVGSWQDGGDGTWEFSAVASQGVNYDAQYRQSGQPEPMPAPPVYDSYLVNYTDPDGKPARFTGHLTRIGDATLLDLFPMTQNTDTEGRNMLAEMLRVPAHMWLKLEIDGERLGLAPVDVDVMGELLKTSESAVGHEEIEGSWLLLTGSTAELRAFVGRHIQDNGFFSDDEDLTLAGHLPGARTNSGVQGGNSGYDQQFRQPTDSTKQKYEQKQKP